MRRLAAIAIACAACGGAQHATASATGDLATEVTLYRDLALVKQRVEVVVGAGKQAVARVAIPPGVAFGDVSVVDRGELTIRQIRGVERADGTIGVGSGSGSATAAGSDLAALAAVDQPGEVDVDVDAPRAGTFAFTVAYTTVRLAWDAAYTVTTTTARDDATLGGAIAIRNTTGFALAGARLWVVDDLFATARQAENGAVAAQLSGAPAPTTPKAVPRDLGVLDVGGGETRVALVRDAHRALHAVLVYDPIGTELDNPSATPTLDPERGVAESKSTKVSESFELVRDASDSGLPGGPVRILERRPDGTLAVLADGTLYGAASRAATTDTVPVGVADGVTARRERRDFSVDADAHRAVEEFSIQLTSTRPAPVDVVVREHLYRGEDWSIAYLPPRVTATKDGQQQVSMRTRVPAANKDAGNDAKSKDAGKDADKTVGKTEVYYVVVYTWPKT
nr:hypothetical protein [Kofleriaceae bacterium]